MKIKQSVGRVLAVGALSAIAVSAVAVPAFAKDGIQVSVPGTGIVHPGDSILFEGTCVAPFNRISSLSSPAIGTADLVGATAGKTKNDPVSAPEWQGTVWPDMRAGTYPVSFKCGDKTVTGSLKVVARTTGTAPVKRPVAAKPSVQQVPVKPKGAPQTGGGYAESVVSTWG